MIRPRSVLAIFRLYEECFTILSPMTARWVLNAEELHDFFYERELDKDLYVTARKLRGPEDLKHLLMAVRDGFGDPMIVDTVEEGQRVLLTCAEAILGVQVSPVNKARLAGKKRDELLRNLELDGYVFKDGTLIRGEPELPEVEELRDEVTTLYRALHLKEFDVLKNHIDKSEQQYVKGEWDTSIIQSRHVMELTLRSIAAALVERPGSEPFKLFHEPVKVRDYLEAVKFLTPSENAYVSGAYKVLSGKGGHPNSSEHEHARIFRRVGIMTAHFALLRFEAMHSTKG